MWLDPLGISRTYLRRLVLAGKLEHVARGIYSSPSSSVTEHRTLVEVSRKVPQAIICLSSALRFHNLTTENPFEVWMALKRGAWSPKSSYGNVPRSKKAYDTKRSNSSSRIFTEINDETGDLPQLLDLTGDFIRHLYADHPRKHCDLQVAHSIAEKSSLDEYRLDEVQLLALASRSLDRMTAWRRTSF